MKSPKKARSNAAQNESDQIFRTNLGFEDLMKKGLNTPLPKKAKKAKKK
jgi:hypothetical protein